MTTNTLQSSVTRRQFMVGAAGLSFTILIDGCAALRTEERGGAGLAAMPADGSLKVNAWASIATDGTIYIANPAVEMGQGSQTAIPLIIAEEMDADWSRVRIVPAAPDDKSYGEIAAFAQIPATAPMIKPEELKKPEQYRLIGKDVMRVELPSKVNGTAQ